MEDIKFPVDILIKIFSNLATKIVVRFRSLSKPWRTILSTSHFIKLHHLNHKPVQESLIFTSRKDPYLHIALTPSDGDHEVVSRVLDIPAARDFIVAGSCNGLVMLLSHPNILVLNPITLQQMSIQSTHSLLGFTEEYGFGCDSRCEDNYKILQISQPDRPSESPTHFYVYSLKDGSWKRLNDCRYSRGYVIFNLDRVGVFVNGVIHWLSRRAHDDVHVILAFDLGTELFSEIPAPPPLINRLGFCKLSMIGNCLIMVGPSSDVTRDVWIMRQYGQVHSWTKYSLASNYYLVGYLKPLCFIKGGNEVLFLNRKGILVVGNLIDGTTRSVIVVAESLKDIPSGCAFVDSLASPAVQ